MYDIAYPQHFNSFLEYSKNISYCIKLARTLAIHNNSYIATAMTLAFEEATLSELWSCSSDLSIAKSIHCYDSK